MRVRGTLAALAALTVLVGCGSTDAEEGDGGAAASGDGAFPVSIEHTFGTTTIEEQPERVVVLGWSAQDVVYSLGVTPVGMPSFSYGGGDDGVLSWDDEHYDAAKTTLLDTADGPPLEDIAALRPDVILAPYEGFDEATYEDLSKIAPTILTEGDDWKLNLREHGEALGRTNDSEELLTDWDNRVARVRRLIGDRKLSVQLSGAAKPGPVGETVLADLGLSSGNGGQEVVRVRSGEEWTGAGGLLGARTVLEDIAKAL